MKLLETLMYVGANRRSRRTGFEHLVQIEPEECVEIARIQANLHEQLASALQAAGADAISKDFLQPQTGMSPACAFVHWYGASTVALQRSAGHDVSEIHVISSEQQDHCRVFYEFEHSDVAREASGLALEFIASLIPALQLEEHLVTTGEDPASLYSEFRKYSAERLLPRDTQAIIDACERLDIPCIKLDRDPYEGITGPFRIRKNGMLKLGHSCYQRIVDGTVCVDRSDINSPLRSDRAAIFTRLTQMNLPVAEQDLMFRNLTRASRAQRSADKLGYPVVVKPNLRGHREGVTLNITDGQELSAAVQTAQQFSRQVTVEKYVSGETWKLVVAGSELVGTVHVETGEDQVKSTHAQWHDIAARLGSELGFGLLVITVVGSDISLTPAEAGCVIVDLDLAPELDLILSGDLRLLSRAAERFVHWIYPENSRSRVPIFSIGGTNGKTTTTRMVSHIMQASGLHPGMASTDGVFINSNLFEKGDLAGVPGHCRVFESKDVDCAVLETAMGSLAHTGLIFDWCDVALCTNVTPDHLGNMGINTLEQLADLKRTALQRARYAVVINADDKLCLGMVPGLEAKNICLVSMVYSQSELAALTATANCFCVLETLDGQDTIVLYRETGRLEVCAVNKIPATFDGLAKFNTSNAQHAIAAAWLGGATIESIRNAMASFHMGIEETPGRLNIYDELPFRVIMDYAHNPDGMRKMGEFATRVNPAGRKLILFAAPGDRMDSEIQDLARSAAGFFDRYYVRSYLRLRGRQPGEIPRMLKQSLVEAGVSEDQVVAVTDPELAVDQVLGDALEGDLVILTASKPEFAGTWQKILQFKVC